ncbi:MAG: enoyl-CoA hydratase-related protein [Candidatus Binatia bacterium]|nr:enoyl-CoA hydratase-related protein [Candidatus Binatia bacterium]
MTTTEHGPYVTFEKDGAVARIILNDPKRANAQTSEMVWGVDDALTQARRDHEVKVVILKANGKGFSSGHIPTGDYPEFQANREAKGTVWEGQTELFLTPMLTLWEFPKPTIAQVHGYALGGGSYWALLPDLTIASEDAYFQMPLVQGMGLPGGETMIEPWLFMNWKKTAEYLLTSQTLSAADALAAGIINRVVPRDDLERTTEELAHRIAKAPGSTLVATKVMIRRAWELMGMRMHQQMSNDLVAVVSSHRDFRDKLESLMESQRKPRQATERSE